METLNQSQRDTVWAYRKEIAIDHAKVSNRDLSDFPLFIALQDAALKSAAYGGHGAHARGDDLLFVGGDGKTRLDHEVGTYDPATGTLNAWVRIPVLSHTQDTIIYLCYGRKEDRVAQNPQAVWDSHYRLVLHLDAGEPHGSTSSTIGEETEEGYDHPPHRPPEHTRCHNGRNLGSQPRLPLRSPSSHRVQMGPAFHDERV